MQADNLDRNTPQFELKLQDRNTAHFDSSMQAEVIKNSFVMIPKKVEMSAAGAGSVPQVIYI